MSKSKLDEIEDRVKELHDEATDGHRDKWHLGNILGEIGALRNAAATEKSLKRPKGE